MTGDPGDPSQALARFFNHDLASPLGVAVSGGSDSLALLFLLNDHFGPDHLHAVTVDHGLRTEAADEARLVARICDQMNLPHTTLRWTGWDGQGNLPDRARRARYALTVDWAREQGITQVALGHTADDQAETLLMRLARGAGAEGLAAMNPHRTQDGVTFLRPLLPVRRTALRDYLTAKGQGWVDDPTNEDIRFERPRIRRAMPDLALIGLTVDALTTTAQNLRSASDAIAHYSAKEAQTHVRVESGDILMPQAALTDMPSDIARRILQAGLRWIAGGEYPPRSASLDRLIQAMKAGDQMPLSGCLASVKSGTIRLTREYAAVAGTSAQPGELWDTRWKMEGPFHPDDRIAAMGEAGLCARPDWRDARLPRTTLLAAPAVWRGETLIAAPLAGDATEYTLQLVRTAEDFHATFGTH